MAHGLPGVLAVLVAAHRAAVPVAGLTDAITGTAELLLDRRTTGGLWPAAVALKTFTAGGSAPAARTAWCYGTPGVAAVLHDAGTALDRPDWRRAAVDAALRDLAEPFGVVDPGLCHGWAGLLHLAAVLGHASGDTRFTAHQHRFADHVLDAYDPGLPFGFSWETKEPPGTTHRAGLLTGTTGIALALHTYATGEPPASGWDRALLLS